MGEVVSVALVHHFHAEAGTVQHVGPGVQDAALTIKDGLVEVEAVQVEGHGRHAKGGEPDADNGPGSQEEVKAAAVVEGSVLEDQATEVTVGSHDVVGLFLLAELVAVVLGLGLGGFTHQGGGHQGAVHGGEQGATEHTCNTQHVEGVHQNVVLSLEHQHVVERAGDAQGHGVREGALTEGVDQEDCRGSSDRCAVGDADPGAHAQAVGKFPLTTHIGVDADQEVEDDELERTAVVQPLIERSSFPDGIEVQADGVAGRNNSTGDDVVAVDQGASDRLADAIDVNRRSGDESDDEADGGSQQGGDHQHTEPTDIQTVVGGGDPLAEGLPAGSAGALLEGGGHENGKKCSRRDGLRKGRDALPPPNVTEVCGVCRRLYEVDVKS